MGPFLSIDETALSQGELYTIITNKEAKGKKGALVGIFKGTRAEPIIDRLLKLPSSLRNKVQEITLDMAHSMKHIAKVCFPKAIQVTDRFHVQKLAIEALQELRIKYRWEAIDQENEQIKQAKEQVKDSCHNYFPTEIAESNSWPEAGIYSINQKISGPIVKKKELLSYLPNILK